MLPLEPRLRQMLRKYIPQLTSHDLDRYECLQAYRLQLIQERDILKKNPEDPEPDDEISKRIKQIVDEENAILEPYRKPYKAVVKFWDAQGRLATQQKNFFQLPVGKSLLAHAHSVRDYGKIQRETFFSRQSRRIRFLTHNLSGPRVALIIFSVLLTVTALVFFYRI